MFNSSEIVNASPARNEVEEFLLKHPDVVEALLVDEEGPDGQIYPTAYVVPHAERMREGKALIYQTDRDKRIAQWKRAFDHVYRLGPNDFAPSFVGWTSSYTNKPIPETEMQEWLDSAIERILSLRPEKVLEIGCGVGLLVQRLAPNCSVYRGTDLSRVAIGRLREFAASKADLRHVELFECEATSLDPQAVGLVDTVVINSVIQYFPDLPYLKAVIEEATRAVSSGGRIFIGDVRHLALLPLFHGATQLSKAPPKATARWLKRKIALAIEQDRELVIDPQFFLELEAQIPRISGVDILLKRGKAHNELTRYRYDVVLRVDDVTPAASATSIMSGEEVQWSAGDSAAEDLVARFKTREIASLTIKNVPNRRLAGDLASVERLWSADDQRLVEDIRRPIDAEADLGGDPEAFWQSAETAQVDVRIRWSSRSADGSFDVTLSARNQSSHPSRPQPAKDSLRLQPLASDPLEANFKQQLGLELLEKLNAELSGSRLPAAVLAVSELPSAKSAIQRPSLNRFDPVADRVENGPKVRSRKPSAHNLALKFQQVVDGAPTAPAVLCGGETYSFETLNRLANRSARWLAAQGVAQGQVVCLELPKSIEAYALALACLKIGAPYSFLDIAAPMERARLMIERCKPRLIVSLREGSGNRVDIGGDVARTALRREIERFDDANLLETEQITSADPAYVMFTSGSTGEPKGVVIPHQGILHLVDWAANDLGVGPGDRLTNVNPIFFDNSVFDIYAGWLNGAAIVALDAQGRPPAELVAEIAAARCTFFFAVPTLFMFLDSMQLLTSGKLPSVSRFMFGGEGFPLARLRRFYDAFAGKARLINCYGPTETSCICSGFDIDASVFDSLEALAPLGRLNPSFSHRILDEDLKPAPAGGVGELWLGGPCVGLGYLNNPEETAKRFRQDPLIEGYRAILYRTGDLVALEPQTGVLRFRGRADNQVKLRGYRVELEEIDHAIAAIPGVLRALAIVMQDKAGSSRLVAAYAGAPVGDDDLLAHCNRHLPSYMVPSRFTRMDHIPTNANGKADRRAVAALLSANDPAKVA